MNNPYFYSFPINYSQQKIGLLRSLFGNTGLAIGNFLNGTQRILNIANQTIPLVKQIKPMVGNAKTMFKIMNEFKKNDKETEIKKTTANSSQTKESNFKEFVVKETNGPNFFL